MSKHSQKPSPLSEKELVAAAERFAAQIEAEQAPAPDGCGNCSFYRYDRDGKIGRCHHGPPTAIGSAPATSNRAWPPVLDDEWCGSHKRK